MSKVIIVAKDTYNALTETNPNNLKYSSEYNTLKYFVSGSKTISVASDVSGTKVHEETVVTHNLGIYPFFVAYLEYNSDGVFYLAPWSFADAGIYFHDFVYTTTTSLIFRDENGSIFGATPAFTVKVYYKIYRNDLGL